MNAILKSYIRIKSLFLIFLTLITYIALKAVTGEKQYLGLQITIWTALAAGLSILFFTGGSIGNIIQKNKLTSRSIIKKVFLSSLLFISLITFMIQNTSANIINSSFVIFLFFLFLSVVFFIKERAIILFNFIILFFIPFLILGKYGKTAENFANLTILLFSFVIVKKMLLLIK